MNLSIWYRHMMKHESGADCFIPNEEIKRNKPKPIGDSHQLIYYWFGEDRKQQPVVMTDGLKAAIKDCLN